MAVRQGWIKWVLVLAVVAGAGVAGFRWFGSSGPSVTALSTVKGVTDPDALSTRLISSDDLPPAGTRSLFDHVVTQSNGVPYPFDKLVASIQKLNPSGEPPVVVMIPHGRSLLKAQANDEHPRLLMAADFQAKNNDASLGLNTKGQLFLGFVENANEIEVLSYNEAAGRYEFQLVQDYSATGARKLVYAKRQVCTTCHQGAAPIFPQRPWNETNASSDTAADIKQARSTSGLPSDQYFGLPTSIGLDKPERFDELTDVGNFFVATQKLWLDGCGDGAQGRACRKAMFKQAVIYAREPGGYRDNSAAANTLRSMQRQQLASKTIAVPESDLPNRDPVAERRGFKGMINALFTPSVKPGEGAKNNEDLDAFDRLPKLPAILDPLTRRPAKRILKADDIDGVYGIASLMTDADISSLYASAGQDAQVLDKAIDRLPDTLFDPAPFARVKFMKALLAEGRLPYSKGEPQYAYWDTKDMSEPIASGLPPVKLSINSPLKPFEQYCFSCHRGNPAKRLNFMAGKSEQEVLENIKKKAEIRDALDWARYQNTDKASKLMPPADSVQHAQIQAALAKQPTLLDDMRKVVPGLFDF